MRRTTLGTRHMTKKTKHKLKKFKAVLKKRPSTRGLGKIRLRKAEPETRLHEALENLPRITNETVAEHREQLLRGSRKYIYPLEHAKSRIIKVSVWLLYGAVIGFFTYVGLALYTFQSTSAFLY